MELSTMALGLSSSLSSTAVLASTTSSSSHSLRTFTRTDRSKWRPNHQKRRPVTASGALKSSTGFGRGTLSSTWDVGGGPWMPRLEDLDTTNMLLRQRILFLGSQVDTLSADLIISQLLFLDAEDQTKDITLFINSPGGSVTASTF